MLPDGIRRDHAVLIEGGVIVGVEPWPGRAEFELVAPGFIDLQVNGHDDVDVAAANGADWDRLDDLLLAQGVTSWCPTLITDDRDALEDRMTRLVAAADRPEPRPRIVAIHLEGPYLGDAHGAHVGVPDGPVDHDWLRDLPDLVRIVTLGPERPGAIEAVELLAERGVLVALGHTTASFGVATAAIDAGARLFTHVFNATGPLHHREPGALGAALTDDRLAVSLIADGVHVHPAVMGLVWRAKPPGMIALVTDAVAWRAGHLAGAGLAHRDGAPRRSDGTLAGSALTMPEAVRYSVEEVGIDLAAAVAAASSTPARLLGLDDRGVIAVGRRADLVAFGADWVVETTWVGGEPVAQPAGLG